MLMVERFCRAELLLLLVLAPSAALAQGQEPILVRLRDAVGDTISPAERDSFHLFPNTAGFSRGVILAIPGPEFFAQVALSPDYTPTPVYYRIMPTQLERIRFLVDNRQDVARQVSSDTAMARALASFWQEIEGRPLDSVAGKPVVVQRVVRKPPEAPPALEPEAEPYTEENRYHLTLLGTTLGSCAGGCVGARAGIKSFGSGIYGVSHPVFCITAGGVTALGSTAGYLLGNKQDRRPPASPPLDEGTSWRTCCCIGAAIPGLTLGLAAGALAATTMYGRGWISVSNDPSNLTVIPAVLTGLCVTIEVATIGYHIGRSIDRNNAARAETRRRALEEQNRPPEEPGPPANAEQNVTPGGE